MTMSVGPLETTPATANPPVVEPEAPAIRAPLDLDGNIIEVFSAALAFAARLGYKDSLEGQPNRGPRGVMESYPFRGQIGHEKAVFAAYEAGRYHHGFGRRLHPQPVPMNAIVSGGQPSAIASREVAPTRTEQVVLSKPPAAQAVGQAATADPRDPSAPHIGRVQKVTTEG